MPIWLQVISTIVTLILAVLTTTFIYRQINLERTKLKLEAYDRRIKVYDSIKIFISEIQTYGTTKNDKLIELLQETRQSIFLFKDKDISNYITKLHNKGVDLEFVQKRLNNERISLNNEERMKLANQSKELFQWFANQHNVVEEKFEKYLRLK